MSRKRAILGLLFLSWPVNNLHRLWDNSPAKRLYWFPGDKSYWSDIQWYVHDIGECLCYIFILLGFWLYINSNLKRDKDVRILFGAVLVNQLIDLPHYLWSHRHTEWILAVQGFIVLLAAGKVMFNNAKSKR
jgi:hypothetical protein